MGTRADFYIGRGKEAQWLGSIAWDGYPDGHPEILKGSTDLKTFLIKLEELKKEVGQDGFTMPEEGWPWPWDDSCSTDYAYAFDGNQVYISCFGSDWYTFEDLGKPGFDCENLKRDVAVFPSMKDIENIQWGSKKAGIVLVRAGGIIND